MDRELDHEALRRESRRLIDRYVEEVALPFELCPWAGPALRDGRVQTAVITEKFSMPSDLVAAAQKVVLVLSGTPSDIDLVLCALPQLDSTRLQMDQLLRETRRFLAEDGEAPFALAAFHPEAPRDTASPERLIPYLRRTPDPLLQAVRARALEKVEGRQPKGTQFLDPSNLNLKDLADPPRESLRLRVARQNQQSLEARGYDAFDRCVSAILEDRERTYIALGVLAEPEAPVG